MSGSSWIPMRPKPPQPFSATPLVSLQRKCACGGKCADCKKKQSTLQRQAAGDTQPAVAPAIVHEVLRSPGQPLDASTRAFMEPRFGHDFSKVRVHADAQAADSAQCVGANAYAVGEHVAFADGRYAPGTPEGRNLLAHELTHVVQQSGAGGFAASLRVGDTGSPSEQEADRMADAVTQNRSAANPARSAAGRMIQRQPQSFKPNLPPTCAQKCGPGATEPSKCSQAKSDLVNKGMNAAAQNLTQASDHFDNAIASPPNVETAKDAPRLTASLRSNFGWSQGGNPADLPTQVRNNLRKAAGLMGTYWIECTGLPGDSTAIMQGAVNQGGHSIGTENCLSNNCFQIGQGLTAATAPHALLHEIFHRVVNSGNQTVNAARDVYRGQPGYPGGQIPVPPSTALNMPDTYASLVDDMKDPAPAPPPTHP